MEKRYSETANIYRALGNPVRLAILSALGKGEMSREELYRRVSVPAPNFAQHLARLRRSRLLRVRRKDKGTYYRIADPQILLLGEAAQKIYRRSYEE